MPDPKFHRRAAAFTLKEIAAASGAQIQQGADENFVLENVAPLGEAGPKDLGFLDNVKYKNQFAKTKAGACIVRPQDAGLAPKGISLLISPAPYITYARAAQLFYPEPRPKPVIAKTAIIDPSAKIGKDCAIEDGAIIRAGVNIGEGCWIEAYAIIGENVEIGAHCRIGSHASVNYAVIGNNVRLYSGARIGQDGFGFAPSAEGPVKVPQLGRVMIEDNVEIGANSCIDRGSGPDTVIGRGTWIDNLVQIGHNVKIGKNCIIAAQVGMSGSAIIEDYAVFGGQAGVSGHIRIGKGARLAGQSGIISDVPAGAEYMGFPARPAKQFLRGVAMLNRLIRKDKIS